MEPPSLCSPTARSWSPGAPTLRICSVGVTELFDPQSGTFGVTGPMMLKYFPDYGYTATLLTDGRVLFLGSDDLPTPPMLRSTTRRLGHSLPLEARSVKKSPLLPALPMERS